MATRPRVEMRLRDVQLPEDTTQAAEIGVILTDKLRLAFSIKREGEGWHACCEERDGATERMHEEAFSSAADCHHAIVTLMIESLPRLTKELTRRVAQQEERDGD